MASVFASVALTFLELENEACTLHKQGAGGPWRQHAGMGATAV